MKIFKYIAIIPAVFCALGCEGIFDNKEIGDFVETDVWRVPNLAEGTLLTVYEAMPARFDYYDNNFLDAATDNAVTGHYASGVYQMATGGMTAFNNPVDDWDNSYTQLQTINQFLEKGLGDNIVYDVENESSNQAIKQRLAGECYFLRAWWHFHLLQRYGGRTDKGAALGIPLSLKYYTPEAAQDFYTFNRASYQTCVDVIMKDLDMASEMLPHAFSGSTTATGIANIGRATALAAGVLKTRVLLYAASPAYQNSEVVDILGMGDFNVVDPAAYSANWEKAVAACDSVVNTSGFGTFIKMSTSLLVDNSGATPADFVLRKYFVANGIENRNYPPFYYGSARTQPSQNLVDAFPSLTGYPISDPRSGYDANDPYAMPRDERFALTLYWNGAKFCASGVIDVVEGGKDSPAFSQEASRTGYYLAKFLSRRDGVLTPGATVTTQHYTPLLRKSEVFYNYAEASNEAYGPMGKGPGCTYSAYDIIKTIRAAYGITDETYLNEMAADKDSFRALIANERRLDFAFEDMRYFDLRRTLSPLDETVKGVTITRNGASLEYSYPELEKRPFDNVRYYYMPIPYSAIKKKPAIVNNMGWE